MDKDALVKTEPLAAGHRRSLRRWYHDRPPVVRIALPFGLAIACIGGAWTVLNEGEYGVALALVALFLLFGIQATRETAWSGTAKWTVSFVLMVIAIYSGAVVVKKAKGKPWSNLLTQREETTQAIQHPTVLPSPVPTSTPNITVMPSPTPTQSPIPTQAPTPSPTASVRLAEMAPQSPTPTPIQSLVYARFLGGDKNPLGRRKTFKVYYPQVRSEIEFEAHFAVRYADNRPRLEVYCKQPAQYGVPAFYYAIEHYSEIKKTLVEESGFTMLETSALITIYPDFVVGMDILRHMSGHANKHGLLLQVVWFKETGKPNEPNPFEP